MASIAGIIKKLGNAPKRVAGKKGSDWWYTPHMNAASRAIVERTALADLVLEVRDARVPWSSKYELPRKCPSLRRIIVLNKMDLANSSQTKAWKTYFGRQNCACYGVNSHNKENIKQFLNFIRATVRKLKISSHTVTVMLVGIPNVGKSALANSLHKIGRLSAAEKGKLKYPVVSPHPGDTKDIISLKIGGHPNTYVLDTPGILPPEIFDDELYLKLALTGTFRDYLTGETELAHYFLAILNLSNEYKKWAKLSTLQDDRLLCDDNSSYSCRHDLDKRRKKKRPMDHTQDLIVQDVRRTLFETVSSFDGNLQNERDLNSLIEAQLSSLREAFLLPMESSEVTNCKVATKLLNLFRTGRLGHYTLDCVPTNAE